jgi:hypothetical protein
MRTMCRAIKVSLGSIFLNKMEESVRGVRGPASLLPAQHAYLIVTTTRVDGLRRLHGVHNFLLLSQ